VTHCIRDYADGSKANACKIVKQNLAVTYKVPKSTDRNEPIYFERHMHERKAHTERQYGMQKGERYFPLENLCQKHLN
jgi:hypothetical protein